MRIAMRSRIDVAGKYSAAKPICRDTSNSRDGLAAAFGMRRMVTARCGFRPGRIGADSDLVEIAQHIELASRMIWRELSHVSSERAKWAKRRHRGLSGGEGSCACRSSAWRTTHSESFPYARHKKS
jgi:hypothetical protein